MKNHVRAFIDEGNDVITIAQLHITTSHDEVSGARVSLIQGSFSDKLTVKLPGISKYGVGEGKPFPQSNLKVRNIFPEHRINLRHA